MKQELKTKTNQNVSTFKKKKKQNNIITKILMTTYETGRGSPGKGPRMSPLCSSLILGSLKPSSTTTLVDKLSSSSLISLKGEADENDN